MPCSWRLRATPGWSADLTFDLLKLDRRISWEQRTSQDKRMLIYLAALELFMLALLGLSVLVFRTTQKLRETGRELSRQVATQKAILKSVDTAILGLIPGATFSIPIPMPWRCWAPPRQAAPGSRQTAVKTAASSPRFQNCSAICRSPSRPAARARPVSALEHARATM